MCIYIRWANLILRSLTIIMGICASVIFAFRCRFRTSPSVLILLGWNLVKHLRMIDGHKYAFEVVPQLLWDLWCTVNYSCHGISKHANGLLNPVLSMLFYFIIINIMQFILAFVGHKYSLNLSFYVNQNWINLRGLSYIKFVI